MMRPLRSSQRGSVVLVALCFVAVLAIAVTTYLTLSSRAMNFSARSFNSGLSSQLSEIGMELAMSAVNNANWTNWTTSGATATRTHTPGANFGQGIAGSVKILVTNRHASNWLASSAYSVGDIAWYRGKWYLCVLAASASNVPPNLSSAWQSTPGTWSAHTFYEIGDVVTHDDTVYRCSLAHIAKAPPESNYWTTVSAGNWSPSTSYSTDDVVTYGGTVYRCVAGNSNQAPTNASYWAGAPTIYVEGTVTVAGAGQTQRTQLRGEIQPAALFPNAVGASNSSTSINIASSGTIESYNSNLLRPAEYSGSTNYVAGAVVYYRTTGQFYRALVAHSGQSPVISGALNSNYWTYAVSSYSAWDSGRTYAIGDMVAHDDLLFRCTASHTNQEPPNTSYWAEQMEYTAWSSVKNYAVDALVTNSAGTVYRSKTSPNLNRALTNTTYWEIHDLTTHATTWDEGTAYAIGDLVSSTGLYYRCISAHTSNAGGNTIANATLWARELVGYPVWKASVAYSVGNVVYYQPPAINGHESSGMLYRCRTAHTSSSGTNPTSSTYWEAGTVDYSTWTSTTGFRVGDIAFYPVTGLLYRCKVAHANQAPASSTVTNTTYWEIASRAYDAWSAATAYAVGDSVFNTTNATVYRCTQAHTNQAPPNASYWSQIGSDFAHWSSGTAYEIGDVVYRTANQTVYRCIEAHTNQTPPNATYWSTAMFGYSAVVAAPAVTSSSTAIIRGFVNATTTSFGSNAIVQGPTSTATPKVDPARVVSNPYVPQFDPPASYAALSGPGTSLPDSEGNGTRLYEGARTLGTPGATTPSVYNITSTYYGGGYSYTSGLYLDSSTDVLTIVGPVILNVSGMLYTNSGRLVVAPTGSLEIYFNGSQLYIGNSAALTANPPPGGIINQTFDPAKMLIVSASTYNSSSYHYYWSRHPFHGLIYMPDAYLHKWNSGFNGEIYGAVSAKTVYFNHAVNVDYDLALRTAGSIGTYIEQPFQIVSWRELTDPTEQISL